MAMSKLQLSWLTSRIEATDSPAKILAVQIFLDLLETFPQLAPAGFDRKQFRIDCDLYDENEEHQRALRKAREDQGRGQ